MTPVMNGVINSEYLKHIDQRKFNLRSISEIIKIHDRS